MGGTGLAIALLVLVAAGAIVQAIRGLGEARQLPPLEPDAEPFFEGDCHVCGTHWQVSLVEQGALQACINCQMGHSRARGGFREWANLPAGAILGVCRGCERQAVVARTDGGPWFCEECYRKARSLP